MTRSRAIFSDKDYLDAQFDGVKQAMADFIAAQGRANADFGSRLSALEKESLARKVEFRVIYSLLMGAGAVITWLSGIWGNVADFFHTIGAHRPS